VPPPVAPPAAIAPDPPGNGDATVPAGGDTLPRVIRRLVLEERELVERANALALELPDPRGRERAIREVAVLREELDAIAAPLAHANGDALDAAVSGLLRIDTRIALLHEALRTATERSSALVLE